MSRSCDLTNPGPEIESPAGQLLTQMTLEEIRRDLEGSFRLGA